MLGESADTPGTDEYCYDLVELDSIGGSAGYDEELVVTDPDELRWCCDGWFRREDGGPGFTLAVVAAAHLCL